MNCEGAHHHHQQQQQLTIFSQTPKQQFLAKYACVEHNVWVDFDPVKQIRRAGLGTAEDVEVRQARQGPRQRGVSLKTRR